MSFHIKRSVCRQQCRQRRSSGAMKQPQHDGNVWNKQRASRSTITATKAKVFFRKWRRFAAAGPSINASCQRLRCRSHLCRGSPGGRPRQYIDLSLRGFLFQPHGVGSAWRGCRLFGPTSTSELKRRSHLSFPVTCWDWCVCDSRTRHLAQGHSALVLLLFILWEVFTCFCVLIS